MNSKLSLLVILFILNVFKFIWQDHIPENEIYNYVFSIPFRNNYVCIGIFGDAFIAGDYN